MTAWSGRWMTVVKNWTCFYVERTFYFSLKEYPRSRLCISRVLHHSEIISIPGSGLFVHLDSVYTFWSLLSSIKIFLLSFYLIAQHVTWCWHKFILDMLRFTRQCAKFTRCTSINISLNDNCLHVESIKSRKTDKEKEKFWFEHNTSLCAVYWPRMSVL